MPLTTREGGGGSSGLSHCFGIASLLRTSLRLTVLLASVLGLGYSDAIPGCSA